jgi:hypothetical protein
MRVIRLNAVEAEDTLTARPPYKNVIPSFFSIPLLFACVALVSLFMRSSLASDDAFFGNDASEFISLKDATGIEHPSQYYAGILAVGDVTGDGYDDILTGSLSNQSNYPKRVNRNRTILLTYDKGTKQYVVDRDFQSVVPEHIWPRRAHIGDFNSDGDNDIYIAAHGTDGDILHCGERNALIEGTSAGFVDSSERLPNVADYSHGLVVANMDGDPSLEVIVLNSPFIDRRRCPSKVTYHNRSYGLDLGMSRSM